MENLDLAYSLFNQYLFQEAKNNIDHVEYYFQTNPNTIGNPLIDQLLYAIKTYQLESIDLPLFQSIIVKTGKSQAEGEKILREILSWKKYSKEQIEPARKYLQDVCAASVIQKANNLYSSHPSEFIKYLKAVNFKTTDRNVLSAIGFDQVDINSIIADSVVDGIPSKYEFINNSFQPEQKYEKGQMIMVTMPPGAGKSIFAMSEALFMASQGFKVHYLAMGDLSMKDFIVRMGAMYSGMSFGDAKKNIGGIYGGMSQLLGDNFNVTIVPAGSITVDEYVDFIEDKNYEVLFVDYDSNFKSNAADGMYNEYGEIYERLTQLTMAGKLLFIMAQPKVGVWGNEVIELQDVGESSRKQHTADMIITRGRVASNPNHLGCFKIVKNRRGEEGDVAYSIRLGNGRFRTVPKGVYDNLKEDKEKRNRTDADIDGLINAYNNAMGGISASNFQQAPAGNQQIQQARSGPSPFAKQYN